jgi:hypothetical protein
VYEKTRLFNDYFHVNVFDLIDYGYGIPTKFKDLNKALEYCKCLEKQGYNQKDKYQIRLIAYTSTSTRTYKFTGV